MIEDLPPDAHVEIISMWPTYILFVVNLVVIAVIFWPAIKTQFKKSVS